MSYEIYFVYFQIVEGNAKQPTILSQMIAEAREIRENLSTRNNASNIAVSKQQNHMESVSLKITLFNYNIFNMFLFRFSNMCF